MNMLLEHFASDGWSRLVMVLFHSLWQGALVALALWFFMRRLPARRANLRYAVSLVSLVAIVLGAVITGSIMEVRDKANAQAPESVVETPVGELNLPVAAQTGLQPVSQKAAQTSTKLGNVAVSLTPTPNAVPPAWLPWVCLFWLAGCGIMSMRLLFQWLDLKRITGPCLPVTDRVIHEVLIRLQGLMGMKQVIRILSGEHIVGPSIYGVIAPKLLLPPALLLGVPVEQLEAIIAHELAHIRRHDYLVNLAQQIVEAALFFNPAVWWINRQIRIEREACCDRLAVEITGKPEAYAWSLEAWARKQREDSLVLAPAFGSERHPAGPLERLKRLLVSDYRPAVRLPWHSFIGMLLISGALFIGLCQGTHLAVGYAAELLTPTQRIEKMTQIQKDYGQQEGAAGEVSPGEKVLVTGTVELENGTLFEGDVSIQINSVSPRYSTSTSAMARNGRFDYRLQPGNIYFAVNFPDYAPVFLGPIEGKPGGKIEDLKAVARAGYSARIKCVDDKNEPLAGAAIDYQYKLASSRCNYGVKTTGPDGIAVFDHLATNTMHFEVTLKGYEYDEREMPTLKPGDPYVWKLAPAKPTIGTVTAAETGKPVMGAKVRLFARENKFQMGYGSLESAPVLAVSTSDGGFELDRLNSASTYILIVESAGFAPQELHDVTAGQNLKIALKPQIDIKGRIIGGLSLLSSNNPEACVTFTIHSTRSSSHTFGRMTPIQIQDGVGYFDITNVIPGVIELKFGNISTNLEVVRSIENLIVDLNKARAANENTTMESGPMREVVLKARVPKDHPAVAGPFKFNYWADANHKGHNGTNAFINGVAHFSVPVPGGFWVESGAIASYWIESLHQTVTADSSPFEVEVEAVPSGVIYGKVVDSDGTEVSEMMVSVIEIAKSPIRKSENTLGVEVKNSSSPYDGPTRFSAQPLPLGGKYVLLARRQGTYVASEPIELTEAQPIREITLKLAPGQEVKGKVLDENNQPVANAEVSLAFMSIYSSFFGSQSKFTDKEGEFSFERVNPEVPGSY
jgi:beta-lactamase regulating signal transducer with metallopeptidase domain